MSCFTLAVAAAFGAFFEVHTIPLDRQPQDTNAVRALTFFANADNDNIADLFIVEKNKLTVFSSAGGMRETVMPQGVTAFDVADINADGLYEIIAVQGRSIFRFTLALQGDLPEPVKLFEADSIYASAYPELTPTVLVTRTDDTNELAIALPTVNGLQLHAFDGALIATREFIDTRNTTIVGHIQSVDSSLYLTISATSRFSSDFDSLTDDETLKLTADTLNKGHGIRADELRQSMSDKPVNWPWFLVHRDPTKATRAYCAVEESLNTLIRMCDVPNSASGLPEAIPNPGPERRYPGAMIPVLDTAPDFNGDGYADMLLWNAPRPGISVDALLRAVVGRNWPIALTTHLYSPDKGRFEPMPATELTFRIPVTWFLTGLVPLRHHVLADFNGDKKTDLGMCTAENEYSVWLYSDGFAATPDEKHTFSENITGIELTGDVAGNGKTSVVLRSDRYVYALFAK